jgi:hypothetical protein
MRLAPLKPNNVDRTRTNRAAASSLPARARISLLRSMSAAMAMR